MRLRDAASKKILVEVALLKAIEARSALSIDSVLKQLQDLRSARGSEVPATPKPASVSSAPAEAAAVAPKRELADGPVSAAPGGDLAELWVKVLDAIGRASPFTRTYLLEAHPVSFQKNVFTIGFDPEFEDHIGLVDNARNHVLLQTKLLELGHPNVQFKFVKAEAPENRGAQAAQPVPPPAPSPAAKAPLPAAASAPVPGATPPAKGKLASVPFNKDDFKNDPLIQKALEIFKGQIVEVRA
jgi:DNA polymerase-3 subunit gamma/tau